MSTFGGFPSGQWGMVPFGFGGASAPGSAYGGAPAPSAAGGTNSCAGCARSNHTRDQCAQRCRAPPGSPAHAAAVAHAQQGRRVPIGPCPHNNEHAAAYDGFGAAVGFAPGHVGAPGVPGGLLSFPGAPPVPQQDPSSQLMTEERALQFFPTASPALRSAYIAEYNRRLSAMGDEALLDLARTQNLSLTAPGSGTALPLSPQAANAQHPNNQLVPFNALAPVPEGPRTVLEGLPISAWSISPDSRNTPFDVRCNLRLSPGDLAACVPMGRRLVNLNHIDFNPQMMLANPLVVSGAAGTALIPMTWRVLISVVDLPSMPQGTNSLTTSTAVVLPTSATALRALGGLQAVVTPGMVAPITLDLGNVDLTTRTSLFLLIAIERTGGSTTVHSNLGTISAEVGITVV